MTCYNCSRGYCQFHEDNRKLSTGLKYSKTYQVYDLEKEEISTVKLREKDRRANPYIEIEEKTATCTKCRRMDTCNNYFVISRTGTANVCICQFCVSTQYANDVELFDYIKKKLLRRYQGSDPNLLELLKTD